MKEKRYQHLDSLRGLAAFLVLWMHGSENFVLRSDNAWVNRLCFELPDMLKIGRIGVVIFFALSGYLIARSLEGRNARVGFPVKRALRLLPIYYFSMLCAYWVVNEHFSGLEILANATMLPTVFGQPEMLGLYWTLQTEVVFYLVLYALSFSPRIHSRNFLLAVAAGLNALYLVIVLASDPQALDSLHLFVKKLPQHLAVMFWGAFVYRTTRAQYFDRKSLALLVFLLLPALVSLGEYALTDKFARPPVMLSYLPALLIPWLVFYFRPANAVAAFFGRISYSVYLNHGIILYVMVELALPSNLLVNMAILIASTTLMSWLTFRWIESPAIDFSHRLVKRWTRERAAGTSPAEPV